MCLKTKKRRSAYYMLLVSLKSEAFALDSILIILSDGNSHHIEELEKEGDALDKRILKLIKDEYIHKIIPFAYTPEYSITSEGKLYIQAGGYCKDVFYKKVQRLQIWFGIVTFIIAIWGFIRTF